MTTSETGKGPTESGFTLIEVLVAFAILLSGTVLAAAVFSRHLKTVQLLQSSALARGIADLQAIETIQRYQQGTPVATEGEEGKFTWRVSKPQPAEGIEALRQAVVEVVWKIGSQDRSMQIPVALPKEASDEAP